jgi:dolichol-phosphate mannosyltransferase
MIANRADGRSGPGGGADRRGHAAAAPRSTTLPDPMPAVWVIVPTYDEADSIERLLRSVAAVLAEAAPADHRILVVDDGSPDGTAAIAERIGEELGVVEVLERSAKGGLGQAYLAGFAHALAAGAQLVCEMDADLSHDPRHLPALLAAAEHAYVPGGGVTNWGLVRRLLSRGGCGYARLILGLPLRDLTGGYKVLHRRVLEAIELESVRSQGYVFQIEVTYRAVLAGFRVAEVPIVFRERDAGTSKMSSTIALEAMWRVPRLRSTAPAAIARAGAKPSAERLLP